MKEGRDKKDQLAVLGGSPIRKDPFPVWPQYDRKEEKNLLQVLYSRNWERHRGKLVSQLEQHFAKLCGVKNCLMVTNGSAALEIALRAAGIEAGDEVLVSPYTFMTTVASILLVNTLPVFIDIHPETYCIDPERIEEKITPRTKAIIPVHIAGLPCDMGKIKEIASRYNLVVIEDACQAHLAEWKGRVVGSIGDAGCFSFQVTKNISAGEGGAITTNDSNIMDFCFTYHTCGRVQGGDWYFHPNLGTNYRMTEFQAAILLAQLERVESQMAIRSKNAAYLSSKLSQVPGISPLVVPEFVTKHAYHLYILRYRPDDFQGLSRDTFVKALQKEGIPGSTGYVELYKEGFFRKTVESQLFKKIFGARRLNKCLSNIHCPVTEKACRKEAVWIPQSVLLGTKKDMDDIVKAVQKIQNQAKKLIHRV